MLAATLRVHSLRRKNSTRSLRWVRLSVDLLCLRVRPVRGGSGCAGKSLSPSQECETEGRRGNWIMFAWDVEEDAIVGGGLGQREVEEDQFREDDQQDERAHGTDAAAAGKVAGMGRGEK